MDQDRINLLLIEDNPADVVFLKEIIKEENRINFNLIHFDSLGSGSEYIQQNQVDLILLDLSLPDSHGLETLRGVVAVSNSIPIIILTGIDDEALGVAALKEGANDYLVKWKIDNKFIIRSMIYSMERFRLQVQLEAARQKERIQHEVAKNIRIYQHLMAIFRGKNSTDDQNPGGVSNNLIEQFSANYRVLVLKYIRAIRIQEDRPADEVRELARDLAASKFRARDVV